MPSVAVVVGWSRASSPGFGTVTVQRSFPTGGSVGRSRYRASVVGVESVLRDPS